MTVRAEPRWQLILGDARDRLQDIPTASVDLVLTDPPYPEIDRDYGRLTVRQWKYLMVDVVREARRVLKPSGSAVFIIQPNSEFVGRMRPWAFEFLAWIARDWNLIQDVWWWNHATMPTVHTTRANGLMRASVKMCVWAGAPKCYRNQDAVLWEPSQATVASRKEASARLVYNPSGHHKRQDRAVNTSVERGGVTPFNLLPIANTNSASSAGAKGHGAGTPYALADWWVRYASPIGGRVLDPFCGSGTVGEAALRAARFFSGVERDAAYYERAATHLQSVALDNPP